MSVFCGGRNRNGHSSCCLGSHCKRRVSPKVPYEKDVFSVSVVGWSEGRRTRVPDECGFHQSLTACGDLVATVLTSKCLAVCLTLISASVVCS